MSDFVSFDSAAVFEVLRRSTGQQLLLYAEFDREDFRIIYASDSLEEALGGDDELAAVGDYLHDHVELETKLRQVLEDLPPLAGDVKANVTRLENVVLLRYYFGQEAVFVALTPDTDVTGVLDALETASVT